MVAELLELFNRLPVKEYSQGTITKQDVAERAGLRQGIAMSLAEVVNMRRLARYGSPFPSCHLFQADRKLLDVIRFYRENIKSDPDAVIRFFDDTLVKDERLEKVLEEQRRERVISGEEDPQPGDIAWLNDYADEQAAMAETIQSAAEAARTAADVAADKARKLAEGRINNTPNPNPPFVSPAG